MLLTRPNNFLSLILSLLLLFQSCWSEPLSYTVSEVKFQYQEGKDLKHVLTQHLSSFRKLEERRFFTFNQLHKGPIDLQIIFNERDLEDVSCRGLLSLGSMCSLGPTIALTQWTSDGMESSEVSSTCTTLTTSDYSCSLSFTDGGVKGIVRGENNTRSFTVQTCENNGDICATIEGESVDNYGDAYENDMVDVLVAGEDRRLDLMEADGSINFLGKWGDCFDGIDDIHALKIGLSVGSTMFNTVYDNDVEVALTHLESMLADVNFIYVQQLHIKLTLYHIEIVHEGASSRPEWDNVDCEMNISTQFSLYRTSSAPSSQGLWHLLDNCPIEGTVGLATVGSLCAGSGHGIDWYHSKLWQTVAHEIGHNFGSGHSFEEGQGTTGGIMDYGDKTLDGEFQFNRKYRFSDICPVLQSKLPECEDANLFFTGETRSVCGNGVVEVSEECECISGTSCEYCESCHLINAECDPLHNPCCSENNTFYSGAQSCDTSEGVGYCRAGVCQNYRCGDFCGVAEDNMCEHACAQCSEVDDNFLLDGTICSSSDFPFLSGQCSSGVCVERTIGLVDTFVEENAGTFFAALAFISFSAFIGLILVVYGRFVNRAREDAIVDSSPPHVSEYTKVVRNGVLVSANEVSERKGNPMFAPTKKNATVPRPPSLPLDLQRDITKRAPKPPTTPPPPRLKRHAASNYSSTLRSNRKSQRSVFSPSSSSVNTRISSYSGRNFKFPPPPPVTSSSESQIPGDFSFNGSAPVQQSNESTGSLRRSYASLGDQNSIHRRPTPPGQPTNAATFASRFPPPGL